MFEPRFENFSHVGAGRALVAYRDTATTSWKDPCAVEAVKHLQRLGINLSAAIDGKVKLYRAQPIYFDFIDDRVVLVDPGSLPRP
jgi:hypothetical protein